ncbi:glycosyltransferase [Methylobacterium gregans]|uniref:D-inositol-3-phosphate glycosyltransferase n=1 Tax=Methylobacterium gregans TaxID=374424 RepID=A0AA37HU63_9HYPH|nr:glycosyltransferase [Methylobacterium gregans]MDQ0521917.1 glycosyltransferase involved in cell wall biosynthesis [Methylobacterium gregans]GJD81998.1 D-inositol-3-phosphate glycosyltransferase [Methylobacterium gregans]GLS52017.1 glycosyl transferase [Methylobacterium gregans]
MRVFLGHTFTARRREIAEAITAIPGTEVAAFDPKGQPVAPGVRPVTFPLPPAPEIERAEVREFAGKVAQAEAAARAALELRRDGFTPDVICGDANTADTLYLKDVWPDARLLVSIDRLWRPESVRGGDEGSSDAERWALRTRNAIRLLALDAADASVTTSQWQRDRLPASYREGVAVVPEGVDTEAFRPDSQARFKLSRGGTLQDGDEVISFSSRILEEARGYGTFVRALPEVLRARPQARVVIAGMFAGTAKTPSADPTWRSVMGQLDPARVEFVGRIPAGQRTRLLQVSAVSVYLTDPAPLTPILFEAMASGCTIVASDVASVREVIEHGRTGVLGSFDRPQALADMLVAVLANADQTRAMRAAARDLTVSRYDVRGCVVPQYLNLIKGLR